MCLKLQAGTVGTYKAFKKKTVLLQYYCFKASYIHLRQLYLAGEDVAKGGEGVVQGFVVNGLVKVLDEHVAHSRLPKGGVSLGPHDSDWLPFDHVKVHGVQGSFSWEGGGCREVNGKVMCGCLHRA